MNCRVPVLLSICLLIIACKKEKVNTDEVRLTGIDIPTNNGDTYHTVFSYSTDGKISRLSSYTNSTAPVTAFDFSYSGDKIIIASPAQNSPSATITDTTWLTVDNNGNVQKKIRHTFLEFKSPANPPQRTFVFDTTLYEYDTQGMLTKESHGLLDSTWFNPGIVQTSTDRITGTRIFTNSNGNVTTINSVSEITSVSHQSGNNYVSKKSSTSTTTFSYTKKYPNQMDFSNASVLNNLNIIMNMMPINKAYANLPDKINFSSADKDANGTVSTNSYEANYTLGYNSYGFLQTSASPSAPDLKTTFIYNR